MDFFGDVEYRHGEELAKQRRVRLGEDERNIRMKIAAVLVEPRLCRVADRLREVNDNKRHLIEQTTMRWILVVVVLAAYHPAL